MQALRSLIDGFIGFLRIHQLLEGAIILISGLILALVMRQVSLRFVRFLTKKYSVNLGKELSASAIRAMWITVILISMHKSVPHLIDKASAGGFMLLAVVESLLIIVWATTFCGIIRIISRNKRSHKVFTHEALQFISNLGIAVVIVNAGFMLLTIWKVDVTPLLASAGIAGLAVALAAKDSLANFFGGVNLFLDRPFKQGDYVVLGTGERGAIAEIGLRSTRIVTRDDIMVCIPNSIIANSKIINESAPEPHHRVRIKIGVAYGSDLDQVEASLLKIAKNEKLVAEKPEPRVRFRSFGESALEFELLCWAHLPAERGLMQHELNKAIYREFNALGIIIPFPQRDIRLVQLGDNKK